MPAIGSLIRNRIWPILFWVWVIWVSGWINSAPVREVESLSAVPKYSNIRFTQMQFEQVSVGNTTLSVESREAQFNSDTKQLQMIEPRLQLKKGDAGVVFTANGKIGKVTTEVTEDTALPSEFRYLELSDGVHVEGKNTSVDSTRLLFDNKTQLFYFPEPSTIRLVDTVMTSKEGMMYNPVTDKLEKLRSSQSKSK